MLTAQRKAAHSGFTVILPVLREMPAPKQKTTRTTSDDHRRTRTCNLLVPSAIEAKRATIAPGSHTKTQRKACYVHREWTVLPSPSSPSKDYVNRIRSKPPHWFVGTRQKNLIVPLIIHEGSKTSILVFLILTSEYS